MHAELRSHEPLRLTEKQLRSLTNAELVHLIHAGDDRAFGVLTQRYRRKMLGLIRHILQDDWVAEDLTQDALIRAYRHRFRMQAHGGICGWLMTIAGNVAKNELRNRKRRRSTSLEQLFMAHGDDDKRLTDPQMGPEDVYHYGYQAELIARAIEALPDEQRQPLLLFVEHQMSLKEISKVLKIPPGTVRSRMARARITLREQIRNRL